MSHHVFICHATEDKAVATVICEALESRGIRCWIAPRNIKPGADYGGAIIKALGEATALVLVLSTHSNESEHVKREVERAVSRGVSVIPFRIEEILPSQALEYFISTAQWVDAFTPPLEKHVGYLVENLKELAPPDAKEVKIAEPPPRPHAEIPQARNWSLTVPSLVMVAVAVVLVVAGMLIILYKTGTFSWPEKATSPEAPEITQNVPAGEEKVMVGKASPEQVLTEEKEPNDHVRNASLIALGKVVAGRIAAENDRDWYKFKSRPTSSKVRVIVRKQFNVEVDIYDQAEKKVESDTKFADEPISFTFESAPDSYYYILVKRYSGDRGPYELEVREEDEHGGAALEKPMAVGKASPEQVLTEEKEPNDHVRNANLIALGKVVAGRIAAENDRDWYKFKSRPTSSKVRVIVRKQFNVEVDIYDQAEKKVESDTKFADEPISFTFESAPDSYYYILVKRYSGDRGPYELEVREEAPG